MNRLSLSLICLLFTFHCNKKPEPHVTSILQKLDSNISAIKASGQCQGEKCHMVAFWDFDGTLLKGDCSEGYDEADSQVYAGIIEEAIDAGLSKQYKPGSYRKFYADYTEKEKKEGKVAAYTYILKIFEGASADILNEVAGRTMKKIWPWAFKSSLSIFNHLREKGVENFVISASSDVFVEEADELLQIPRENFHGIEVKIKRGLISSELVEPVTYAEGKAEKIRRIVAERLKRYDRVFIVAGFGNSYHTDGPFLKYISRQTLVDSYKPVVMMINGGEPPSEYLGIFTLVTQKVTIGKK